MPHKPLPRWLGVSALLVIATVIGSNHVAARVAFDHGVNVTTAVAVRSTGTALAVLALLVVLRAPLALPAARLRHAMLVGLMVAVQSFTLYSAVARIPVVLALLAFNIYPMLLTLMTWASGGPRPTRVALGAMVAALIGLALALDVAGKSGDMAGRWAEIGAGLGFAITGAFAFAGVLFFSTRWLADVDGRLRSCIAMGTVGVLAIAGGGIAGNLALPTDTPGWLGLGLLTVFYGSAITAMFVVLPRVDSPSLTAVLNFEPIAVLFLGWVILGQALAPLQLVGALIVIGAIITLGIAKG